MENSKRIACLAMAGTIVITGMAFTINSVLKRKSDYDGKIITTTTYSTQYESNTTTGSSTSFEIIEETTIINTTEKKEETTVSTTQTFQETTTNKNNFIDTEIKNDVVSYAELKQELNKVIDSKKLTADSKKLLNMSFDYIYNNYDSFEEVYKNNGVVTKEDFIKNNIINNLKNNVSVFEVINLSEYDGEEFGGDYSPSDQSLRVGFYGNFNDESTLRKIVHELTHSGQLGLYNNPSLDSETLNIFTEGEALVNESIGSTRFLLNSGMNFSTGNFNECYSIKGIRSSNPEYIIYSKCYGSLLSVVDYDCLQKVKSTGDISLVSKYLTETYNIHGSSLLNEMTQLCYSYIAGDEEKICSNIENIESTINKCFMQKLDNCSTKEDVMNFMNLKRFYNMQFSSVCLKNYEDEYAFDIAKKSKLDPYNVDDTLYNKCMEYDIIQTLSNDEGKNKMIFDSIMGRSTDYFSYFSVGEQKSITSQKYSLSDDENVLTIYDSKGNVTLQFNYSANEVIRDKENINSKYVVSSPYSIVNNNFSKVM